MEPNPTQYRPEEWTGPDFAGLELYQPGPLPTRGDGVLWPLFCGMATIAGILLLVSLVG